MFILSYFHICIVLAILFLYVTALLCTLFFNILSKETKRFLFVINKMLIFVSNTIFCSLSKHFHDVKISFFFFFLITSQYVYGIAPCLLASFACLLMLKIVSATDNLCMGVIASGIERRIETIVSPRGPDHHSVYF